MSLQYNIKDKPNSLKEWVGYPLQVVFSCLTATLLITLICWGGPNGVITAERLAAGLMAAGISTLFFLCITKFRAPIVISNSGATAGIVQSTLWTTVGGIALANPTSQSITAVLFGGIAVGIVYCIAAALVKRFGIGWITKLITPVMSGAIIITIGIQLGFFVPTYAQIGGSYSMLGVGICFMTLFLIFACVFWGRGYFKRWPILFGVIGSYLICILLSLCGVEGLINLDNFKLITALTKPDFAFLHFDFKNFDWSVVPQTMLGFGLVSLGALAEHLGDMINASNICEQDLLSNPGLHRTLVADGLGSVLGCAIGGMPNTTFSENLGTILISRCASVYVTLVAAVELILLGLIGPFNIFVANMPNACFAGASIGCYGIIAASGVNMLIKSGVDFSKNKNLWIFSLMIILGTSGLKVTFGNFTMTGICLAIVGGILFNIIFKEKE